MCWYCHWGLPERVADLFRRAESAIGYDDFHWGPGHIVFEDTNLDDDSIRYCIEKCDDDPQHWTLDAGAACKSFLEELLAIPEEERDPAPDKYGNPADYPPPPGARMVKDYRA